MIDMKWLPRWRHFHDGHAAAVPVEHFRLRTLQHGLRHRRRAGAEVPNSLRHKRFVEDERCNSGRGERAVGEAARSEA
jgi:hypothetical protein